MARQRCTPGPRVPSPQSRVRPGPAPATASSPGPMASAAPAEPAGSKGLRKSSSPQAPRKRRHGQAGGKLPLPGVIYLELCLEGTRGRWGQNESVVRSEAG